MRRTIAATVATLVLSGVAALAQPAGSVWDGIYTEAQAGQGAQDFGAHCASCHGASLSGTGEAPGLEGALFVSDFNGETVGDLFDRVRSTMPQDNPASLSRDQYAAILAFILKANGFPAGAKELDRRSEYLKAIAFQATNPHPAAPAGGGARPARTAPADLAALDAANKASGVLSATAGDPRNAPNSQSNPYAADTGFFKLPAGRSMGSSSAVAVDSKGHIWVAERCGANDCAGSHLDPIMEFDAKGNFIKAFGAGMLLFPHGFTIDAHDHIWVTDGHVANGIGYDVLEFDQNGSLLMTLGRPGVGGADDKTFEAPNAVLVTPEGTIFVSDGHEAGPSHNARIVKFDAHGKFLKQWGAGHGVGAGQLDVPHCLAMDSQGHLYVGDRWNNRIQEFDQDGRLLQIFTQFGRPSGIAIDKNDILYVTDSESRAMPGQYGNHPGWKRGIRIGSVRDGIVTAFIPDTDPNPDAGTTSGGEGIWVDTRGVIYSAQVEQKTIVRYVRK
jgi:sugar lactone lactonase YvrE/mono/diheme cytochrome c family protein